MRRVMLLAALLLSGCTDARTADRVTMQVKVRVDTFWIVDNFESGERYRAENLAPVLKQPYRCAWLAHGY